MRILILILVGFLVNTSQAQYAVSGDPQGGTPMSAISYITMKGTPYLLPYWAKGEIRLENDKVLKNLQIQYDMLRDKVSFIDHTGAMMEPAKPLAYFEVFDSAIFNIRKFKRAESAGYYEILLEGEVPLYKKVTKSLVDGNNLGTANTAKTVLESVSYYSIIEKKVHKIKLSRSSVSMIFNNSDEFANYVNGEQINFKSEKDLIRLFGHLNAQP